MARFGRNLKLSFDAARRDDVRRFFTEGFGATLKPAGDAIDLFAFADGASVGAFYVTADRVLPDSAWDAAPWLEFLVEDVPAAEARLLAAGATRVDFADTSHPYLKTPSGPVFRLARA